MKHHSHLPQRPRINICYDSKCDKQIVNCYWCPTYEKYDYNAYQHFNYLNQKNQKNIHLGK